MLLGGASEFAFVATGFLFNRSLCKLPDDRVTTQACTASPYELRDFLSNLSPHDSIDRALGGCFSGPALRFSALNNPACKTLNRRHPSPCRALSGKAKDPSYSFCIRSGRLLGGRPSICFCSGRLAL